MGSVTAAHGPWPGVMAAGTAPGMALGTAQGQLAGCCSAGTGCSACVHIQLPRLGAKQQREMGVQNCFFSLYMIFFSLFSHCKECPPPAVTSRELQVRKQHERSYQTLLPCRHWQNAPAPRVLWRECVTLRASEQWEGNNQDGADASPAICQG